MSLANRSIERLKSQLGELDARVGRGDAALRVRAAAVSGWSVGEEIDHALQVMTSQLSMVASRREVPGTVSLLGRLLLALGWMPRGIGQAERAQPRNSSTQALRLALAKARALLTRIEGDPDLARFRWPVSRPPGFGQLNAPRSLRFAAMHTDHHLKIVRDLETAARGR